MGNQRLYGAVESLGGGPSMFSRLGRFYSPFVRPEDGVVVATIGGMFGLLGRKWRVLVTLAVTGAFLGFVAAWLLPPKYVAVMTLIPNVEEQYGSLASVSGSLGSLGSLVSGGGLTKPENVTPFQRFRAIMDSQDVAEEMERRGRFLERLYPDRWDAQHNEWRPKSAGVITSSKDFVKRVLRLPVHDHPAADDLAAMIHAKVSVSEDEKQSLYTFSFAAKDSQLAKEFLSTLYASIETVLLRHERATADARVKAALQQIDKTDIASERLSLQNVLGLFQMHQIQVDVGSPFGARILAGPTAPDQPNDPSVLAFMGGGLLAGLILSTLLVLVLGMRVARDFPHDVRDGFGVSRNPVL